MSKGNPVIIKSGSYLEPPNSISSKDHLCIEKDILAKDLYFGGKLWINFCIVLEFVAFRGNLINISGESFSAGF